MKFKFEAYLLFICFLLGSSAVFAQNDVPISIDGGKGFVNTQAASIYGRGFIGVNFTSIYNTTKITGIDGREQLFIGISSFTYDFSSDVEVAASLYAVGRGVLYSGSGRNDALQSGFGKAVLGMKYQFPLASNNFEMGMRSSIHIPMGADFTIHPSYPYDTNVYALDLIGLFTFRLPRAYHLHFNGGYRWEGLREKYVGRDDLWITNLALDYKFNPKWRGYNEISSTVELDNKIQPFYDRLIFVQGIQYLTPWNFSVNMAGNFRLNKARLDDTPTRAENWRVMFGISLSSRTYQPDDDNDGVPNIRDKEPNTPKGWAVNSNGRALDSDNDGIADGMDKEKNTPFGAIVDRFGVSIDSDNDSVPDGIDLEPNSPSGAVVNAKGVAIDSDADGIPDGIDVEPNSPSGAVVDAKGKSLPPMEIDLLKNGILRVHKIYFDVGKAQIKPQSHVVLNEIGRIVEKHPELQIQINGYTDASGNDDFNYKLSVERVNVVRDYLLANYPKILEDNLVGRGYGRSKPLTNDKTEEGRALNRRVEFEVLNFNQPNAQK